MYLLEIYAHPYYGNDYEELFKRRIAKSFTDIQAWIEAEANKWTNGRGFNVVYNDYGGGEIFINAEELSKQELNEYPGIELEPLFVFTATKIALL